MTTSHFALMVVFSLFVSIVFATLMRDQPAEQLRLGARLFAGFVGAGIVIGWLLYPLPL
jgi:galactitol-specific phosphotransferase system IIC component